MLPALVTCLALGACGSDDSGGEEIPQERATAMTDALDRLDEAAAAENCEAAETAFADLSEEVEALGDDVEEGIRDNLEVAAAQVNDLVEREVCAEVGATGEEEVAPPVEEPAPAPEEEPPAEEEPPPPEEEEEQPEEGEGDEGEDSGEDGADSGAPPEQPSGEGGSGNVEQAPPSGGVGAGEEGGE
jgi:hypothetical protein